YFVMEYVEGTTIQQELDAKKVYEEREAVEIALQIAQALQHAKRRKLIHRDIKPANIILTRERVAKLADLGLARGTRDRALAKDREQRYRSPDDLIIDLECLMNGEPPKLARQRIKAATLAELSQGEEEADEGGRRRGDQALPWLLGVLLGVSAVVNLILFLKR